MFCCHHAYCRVSLGVLPLSTEYCLFTPLTAGFGRGSDTYIMRCGPSWKREFFVNCIPCNHARNTAQGGLQSPNPHTGQTPVFMTDPLPYVYTPMSLEHGAAYQRLYDAMPVHPVSYSLASLWSWAAWQHTHWRFAHGLCWFMSMDSNGKLASASAPVGPWEEVHWPSLRAELAAIGSFGFVPHRLAAIWERELPKGSVLIEDTRDNWEYIYATEDIATLTGNAYRAQRNHVNALLREHGEPEYRVLSKDDVPAIMALAKKWELEHEQNHMLLGAEVDTCVQLLHAWEHFEGLKVSGLYIDKALVAFEVGVSLDSRTLGVLYEKAMPGLRGAFQMMAKTFAQNAGNGFERLNRAEDMGVDGLRQAKMKYRPVDFEKMCSVRILA